MENIAFEPAMVNRFIIKFNEIKIPDYFFRKYKIYNDGEDLIFKTTFMESVNYTFNPQDFFKIRNVEINYLDPVGSAHNGLRFSVKGCNFKKVGSYSKEGFTLNKFKFIIDKNSLVLLYHNIL